MCSSLAQGKESRSQEPVRMGRWGLNVHRRRSRVRVFLFRSMVKPAEARLSRVEVFDQRKDSLWMGTSGKHFTQEATQSRAARLRLRNNPEQTHHHREDKRSRVDHSPASHTRRVGAGKKLESLLNWRKIPITLIYHERGEGKAHT